MNKLSFKQFLNENGYPFLNVFNDKMETLFGHTETDYVKDKAPPKLRNHEKIKKKHNAYLRYAKNINEDKHNEHKK